MTMAQEKKDYPVISPVKAGGRRVEVGGVISLTEAEAEALKAAGVIAEPLTAEQVAEARAAKISAFVMSLTLADMGKKGGLSEAGTAKAEATLGFVPDADEVRQGMEAWAKAGKGADAAKE